MRTSQSRSGQKGYVLLALMLAVTIMLILLAVEAPRIAQQIKREREEELVHRGKDYATAIKRYVHKNGGRYPVSIDQLENTNHVRFLRKRYKDPITGEDNWRLVRFGEAQINIPAPNPGLSGGTGTLGGSNIGGGSGSNSSVGGQLGQTQPPPGGTGTLGTLTTSNIGNGQTVGGGPIIGVASVNKGIAIKEFNDKDHYDEWFFVYDLRLEQSGGTGVTVASPRGGSGSGTGQGQPGPSSGGNIPSGAPTPTPSPVPN